MNHNNIQNGLDVRSVPNTDVFQQTAGNGETGRSRFRINASVRRLFGAAGIAFPLVVGTAATSQACGLEVGGTALPADASDAEIVPETSMGDGNWTPDGETDADTIDVVDAAEDVKDAAPDGIADTGVDTGVDAGPTVAFSNDADKNNCIHWLTANGGITQSLKSDNHVCEPKPVASMPIAAGYDVYVWSKDAPNNNKVRFATPINATNYYTKCSSYTLPPNKAEMETELVGGGYIATGNAAVLPDVELTNAGCPNGAAFVVHIAP
jgi:hypothetical protein